MKKIKRIELKILLAGFFLCGNLLSAGWIPEKSKTSESEKTSEATLVDINPDKNKKKSNDTPKAEPSKTLSAFENKGFSQIVKPVLQAIVNINTEKNITPPKMEVPDNLQGSPMEDFFRQFFDQMNKMPQNRKARSLGSGFIVHYDAAKKEGIIVTNYHIVSDADEIKVTLPDEEKTSIKAEIIGKDSRTDIAVLKIKSDKPLTTVKWGDSTQIEVGEWAIAIGNPFGLGSTVTAGIISTLGREIPIANYVDGYIQTDAAINQGNSGGPLLNVKGEVIGMNTAILASSGGGNIGIGFAIPSSIAEKVVKQLTELGKTRRGWLGAGVLKVTDEIAESLGMKRPYGAMVAKVYEKSPAEKAGIKRGDVILKFNGQEVRNSSHLPRMVGESDIGATLPVVLWREGKEETVKVKVGEFEEAEANGLIENETEGEKESTKKGPATKEGKVVLGMELLTLNDSIRKKFGIADSVKGVLVFKVDRESEAAEKGIQKGDVIVEAGRQEVSKPEDFEDKLKKDNEKGLKRTLLLINRSGDLRFVTLSNEAKKEDVSKKEDSSKEEKVEKKDENSDSTKDKSKADSKDEKTDDKKDKSEKEDKK